MEINQIIKIHIYVLTAIGFRMKLGGKSVGPSKRLVWSGIIFEGIPGNIYSCGYRRLE